MPRVSRQLAKSGYYHVMIRGAGRQLLFDCDSDRVEFLSILKKGLSKYSVELVAWCLMDNHVHLLLHIAGEELALFMHYVETCYAVRFNARTGRVGPVFQGRFKSKAIEDDSYLLAAVRYIHNNPLELGVGREEYRWSSYFEYLNGPSITSTELVLGMLGGVPAFKEFSGKGSDGYSPRFNVRLTRAEIASAVSDVLGGIDPGDVKALPVQKRDELIAQLSRAGLSARQIERETGVGRGVISRVLSRS